MEAFMKASMETLFRKFLWKIALLTVVPVTILLLSIGSAQAREMPYFWKGIRPLGMGGAFTAIADDYNALFYNPAGLDKVPHWSFAVLNPMVEVGENSQSLYKDIMDINDGNLDTPEVIDLMRKHVGEYQHLRASLFPHFVKQHFGFGVLGQAVVNADVSNSLYPEAKVSALVDMAGVGGAGFGFLDDHALRVGMAAKYVKRQCLPETIYTAAQIASDNFDDTINDDLVKGSGLGFDLGALYTFPVFLKPTAALVIQNIGGINLGDAGEIPQQINLGAGLHYEYGIISANAGLDLMDVTRNVNQDEKDYFRRLHTGAESWFGKRLALRLGLYQGYVSAGVALNLWVLKLDYANYAEEVGVYAGQRVDRRNVVQVSLGW